MHQFLTNGSKVGVSQASFCRPSQQGDQALFSMGQQHFAALLQWLFLTKFQYNFVAFISQNKSLKYLVLA